MTSLLSDCHILPQTYKAQENHVQDRTFQVFQPVVVDFIPRLNVLLPHHHSDVRSDLLECLPNRWIARAGPQVLHRECTLELASSNPLIPSSSDFSFPSPLFPEIIPEPQLHLWKRCAIIILLYEKEGVVSLTVCMYMFLFGRSSRIND